MIYTKYNKNTGKIISSIFVSNISDLQQNLKEGEAAIEGKFSGKTYYVNSQNEISNLPLKPDGHYDFDYETLLWVPNFDLQWLFIKKKRNELLELSDWTQLPDVPLATKEVWATYRQALRDITEQPDPFNIVWPQPPE